MREPPRAENGSAMMLFQAARLRTKLCVDADTAAAKRVAEMIASAVLDDPAWFWKNLKKRCRASAVARQALLGSLSRRACRSRRHWRSGRSPGRRSGAADDSASAAPPSASSRRARPAWQTELPARRPHDARAAVTDGALIRKETRFVGVTNQMGKTGAPRCCTASTRSCPMRPN
jgi:hypothetical protein